MKQKVEILFQFETAGIVIRGVKDTKGYFRLDKKRVDSKTFKPIMWTGSRETLETYNTQEYRGYIRLFNRDGR